MPGRGIWARPRTQRHNERLDDGRPGAELTKEVANEEADRALSPLGPESKLSETSPGYQLPSTRRRSSVMLAALRWHRSKRKLLPAKDAKGQRVIPTALQLALPRSHSIFGPGGAALQGTVENCGDPETTELAPPGFQQVPGRLAHGGRYGNQCLHCLYALSSGSLGVETECGREQHSPAGVGASLRGNKWGTW